MHAGDVCGYADLALSQFDRILVSTFIIQNTCHSYHATGLPKPTPDIIFYPCQHLKSSLKDTYTMWTLLAHTSNNEPWFLFKKPYPSFWMFCFHISKSSLMLCFITAISFNSAASGDEPSASPVTHYYLLDFLTWCMTSLRVDFINLTLLSSLTKWREVKHRLNYIKAFWSVLQQSCETSRG